jgi:hypothetical protein
MATLAELLRQGADTVVNMPTEARRFMTNPQAFTQALTGKNLLPKETGFAAGALGVPANSQNIEYQQGFQQGEPYELPIALASMGAPLVVPAAKALAPKAAQMAENYMAKQGFMPNIVEQTSKPVSPSSLQSVVEPIKERGLIVDAYESNKSPVITLSRIEVPKEMRSTGMGTQALQELAQYADQSVKTIALSPSKDFGASSVNRLKDFYKRFGFVENKGRNKDFSISESMYRPPTQPTRKEIIAQELEKVQPTVDYRGSHIPPNYKEYGAPLHDLTQIMPKDIYSADAKRLYGIGDSIIDSEWRIAALKAKGKPDAEIEVFRAVPKGVKDINSGDWVTTSKKYATNHGENTLGGEYEIVSKKVKANTLSSEGYPYEFGYHE